MVSLSGAAGRISFSEVEGLISDKGRRLVAGEGSWLDFY
jgi:hypothetical protein